MSRRPSTVRVMQTHEPTVRYGLKNSCRYSRMTSANKSFGCVLHSGKTTRHSLTCSNRSSTSSALACPSVAATYL